MNLRTAATTAVDTVGNALLRPPYGGTGFFYNHGPRNKRRVALTFDDGPSRPCTPLMLETLESLNVKATFFCIGLNTTWHGDVLAAAYAAGHVIGNHSMMHSRVAGLKPTGGDHIDASERVISDIIGVRPRLYRPPWGWLTPWEGLRLKQRGYNIIGWDVFTYDWQTPVVPGAQIAAGVCRDVRPGSIVLLHDSISNHRHCDKPNTNDAVRLIVPELRARGYEFVTVPELLGVQAYAALR